jgi:uncharacterized protein YndB with AHSA1/START domain
MVGADCGMEPIVESIEVSRSAEDVFACIGDPARGKEWQGEIVSTKIELDGRMRPGARWVDTRRSRAGRYRVSYEVTEFDPPRRTEFKTLGGPLSLVGSVEVEPLNEGSDSLVTIRLQYEDGRGIGKLLTPLVRRQSQRQVPKDLARLKELLESGGT